MFKFRFGPAVDSGPTDNPTRTQTVTVDGKIVAKLTLSQLQDGVVAPDPTRIAFVATTEHAVESIDDARAPVTRKRKGS